MKELFEELISAANRLDDKGYELEADLIEAVLKNLINDRKSNKKETKKTDNDEPEKVKEEKEQVNNDMKEVREKLVDNESIKDLFDLKEELKKIKISKEYDLTEDEYEEVYEQLLEDKFKREYSEKEKEELEEELNKLTEDRKRKGELDREEEMDYKMIDEIYKRKSHEDVRPSDKS